jgi:dynein heavy chain
LSRRIVFDFLDNVDSTAVFVKENRGSIEVSDIPEKSLKSSLFYIVKLYKNQVSTTNFAREIVYGDITADPLDYVAVLSERIYHPLVSSRKISQNWSESIAKELRDRFDVFVSNVQITQGNPS